MNIKQLYYTMADEEKARNPFETAESDRLADIVYDEYIALHGDETNNFSGQCALSECIENERLTAFTIGFKTAMQLFMDGLSPNQSNNTPRATE